MLAEIARHRRGAALGGADEEEVRCGPAAVACRDGHGCSSGAHAKRGNRRAADIDSSLRAGCPKATTARSPPSAAPPPPRDRKSGVQGKRVDVRVDLGGRRRYQKTQQNQHKKK